jgi:hypothetical protein
VWRALDVDRHANTIAPRVAPLARCASRMPKVRERARKDAADDASLVVAGPSPDHRPRYASKPRTSRSARRISGQRASGSAAIHGPRYSRPTMRIHSGFRTHGVGTPSASVNATSHDRPRALVEMGKTGTWLNDGRMSGLPSTRTGRRLSGALKRNHRISPRAITAARVRRRPRWGR